MTSKINFEFLNMLESGELTDCVFELKDKSSETEKPMLIRAHKLILSAVSPVFKAMISKEWSSDRKPIEIKEVDPKLFMHFIRSIYANVLYIEGNYNKKDLLETMLNLYKLGHMYQTEHFLEQLTTDIIDNITNYSYQFDKVFRVSELAKLFGNKPLRKACKNIIAKRIKYVLEKPEFLKLELQSVNMLYMMDPLDIKSEGTLVTALDRYIEHNKNTIPEIMVKLKVAIESIRILLVDKSVIEKCVNEDFKKLLFKRQRMYEVFPTNDPGKMKMSKFRQTLN